MSKASVSQSVRRTDKHTRCHNALHLCSIVFLSWPPPCTPSQWQCWTIISLHYERDGDERSTKGILEHHFLPALLKGVQLFEDEAIFCQSVVQSCERICASRNRTLTLDNNLSHRNRITLKTTWRYWLRVRQSRSRGRGGLQDTRCPLWRIGLASFTATEGECLSLPPSPQNVSHSHMQPWGTAQLMPYNYAKLR